MLSSIYRFNAVPLLPTSPVVDENKIKSPKNDFKESHPQSRNANGDISNTIQYDSLISDTKCVFLCLAFSFTMVVLSNMDVQAPKGQAKERLKDDQAVDTEREHTEKEHHAAFEAEESSNMECSTKHEQKSALIVLSNKDDRLQKEHTKDVLIDEQTVDQQRKHTEHKTRSNIKCRIKEEHELVLSPNPNDSKGRVDFLVGAPSHSNTFTISNIHALDNVKGNFPTEGADEVVGTSQSAYHCSPSNEVMLDQEEVENHPSMMDSMKVLERIRLHMTSSSLMEVAHGVQNLEYYLEDNDSLSSPRRKELHDTYAGLVTPCKNVENDECIDTNLVRTPAYERAISQTEEMARYMAEEVDGLCSTTSGSEETHEVQNLEYSLEENDSLSSPRRKELHDTYAELVTPCKNVENECIGTNIVRTPAYERAISQTEEMARHMAEEVDGLCSTTSCSEEGRLDFPSCSLMSLEVDEKDNNQTEEN